MSSAFPMQLPKLTPGQRYTLPRPIASADAALLTQLAARDKAEGQPETWLIRFWVLT